MKQDSTLALLVLAAGLGSRYHGLKQFEGMGPAGHPLLDYSIYDAQKAGFNRIVLVVQAMHRETMTTAIRERLPKGLDLAFATQEIADIPAGSQVSSQRTKPWGTLHAVLSARDIIDSPFAVINADDYYGPQAYQKAAQFLRHHQGAGLGPERYCMVGYPMGETLSAHGGVNRGRCLYQADLLVGVEEIVDIRLQPDGSCQGFDLQGHSVRLDYRDPISMNFWGFTPAIFAHMTDYFRGFLQGHGHSVSTECYIPSVVNHVVRQGLAECTLLSSQDTWLGVTHPQDRAAMQDRLHALVRQGTYPENLWSQPIR